MASDDNVCKDTGLLILRLVTGGLLAGHGSQKLFGLFNGPGPEGTGGFMEQLGLKPGQCWGLAAGAGELAGGALTAMGFLNPLGPIAAMSVMVMAAGTAHAGKPIWVTEGGAELPAVNLAAFMAVAVGGQGQFSIDRALGIKLPFWLKIGAGLAAVGAIGYGLASREVAPGGDQPGDGGQ